MEQKTKVNAEEGKHDMIITREFDLPVALLFKAYEEAELLEQWMGTKVVKLESRRHGSYEFETSDPKGNVTFRASGVIHEFIPVKKITRTFEMNNAPFGVQLEVYQFEKLTDDTSKLTMHVIYESVEQRDQLLKLPFAQGLNWAHTRLEETLQKLK
ncbi:MAG TPA: SRPBCC domain-containing protein [Chitinophagaceae bacterium]|nr:SRPBCC domain-containing protein [Chitinophagaceae bacterium]